MFNQPSKYINDPFINLLSFVVVRFSPSVYVGMHVMADSSTESQSLLTFKLDEIGSQRFGHTRNIQKSIPNENWIQFIMHGYGCCCKSYFAGILII